MISMAIVAVFSTMMAPIRPPAVPLVVHDPYFSIWSPSEVLSSADTRHWTGDGDKIFVTARIDDKAYRLVGKSRGPKDALPQTRLQVFPTRTQATFEGAGIGLTLTFMTPAVPSDLAIFSQPRTFLEWKVGSVDGKSHDVQVTVEASAHIATNRDEQTVVFSQATVGDTEFVSVKSTEQPVLVSKGDGIQIDWGTLYLGGPAASVERSESVSRPLSGMPQAKDSYAKLVFANSKVGAQPTSGHAVFCYDDEYSIQYFKQNLRPYWRKNGMTAERLLASSGRDLDRLRSMCESFDEELITDLDRVGGPKYSSLASLAYRQTVAGNKLVADPNGQPLWFPKENTSNGCIATVDVIYPMAPQAFLFGPTLTKALLMPVLAYSASPRWKFPFAPHDLGTYPHANGQVYGGGEKSEENQMPVEESANMLILMAGLAKIEGNADFAGRYWTQLSQWASYLREKGLDPENQLCTDDFLGHLAHNVNLSAKAVLGLRSYAYLSELLGKSQDAAAYKSLSEQYAKEWTVKATRDGRTLLTFDRPGTWSQKYNLVWDRILGFGLFPDEVRDREMAFYKTQLNPYGLPLDSRGTGAKLDWSIWTATLTQNRDDFDALIAGVYRFVDESRQRVAMGDWYDTAKGNFNFMHTRPVVGGAFLPMLYDAPTWKKWAARDKVVLGRWAEIPKPPVITPLVASSETNGLKWKFTTESPAEDWSKASFDDASWRVGEGGFGIAGTPGAVVRTPWSGNTIWLRREFELPASALDAKSRSAIHLWIHHDEDVEVFLNGILAVKRAGWTTEYEPVAISAAAKKGLKAGKNVIAIRCRQTAGGQYIDAGLVLAK